MTETDETNNCSSITNTFGEGTSTPTPTPRVCPSLNKGVSATCDPVFLELSPETTEADPGATVGFTITYTYTLKSSAPDPNDVAVTLVSAVQHVKNPDGTTAAIPASGASVAVVSRSPGTIMGTVTLPPVPDAAVTIQAATCGCQGYATSVEALTRTATITTPPAPASLASASPLPSSSPGAGGPGFGATLLGRAPRAALPTAATTLVTASALAAIPALLSLLTPLANALSSLSQRSHFFGSLLSLRRRKGRWGLVVDSDLGKPIARAIVQIYDAAYGKLRETQFTGPDGQFGFLIPPGTYTFAARQAGFQFPATHLPPLTLQTGERFYLGGDVGIREENPETIPHLIIPLDREEEVSGAQIAARRVWERTLAILEKISLPLLIVSAALNTLFVLLAPGALNILFEVVYGALIALKAYVSLTRQKGIGSVLDALTGTPVGLAAIRVYDASANRLVQTRVTSADGRFFILLPKGEYTIAVSKGGYEPLRHDRLTIRGRQAKAVGLDLKLHPASASPPSAPPRNQPPKKLTY